MENLNWVAVLLSVVSTYLILHTLHESYELKWTEIEFGEFQVHPASMGKSFFFFSFVRAREERSNMFL